MVQNFGAPQKTRQAVILFLKGSATPVVMYFDNPATLLMLDIFLPNYFFNH